MRTFKVICFYKDAPDLCGELYRSPWVENGNLYSYEQAIELILTKENDKVYNGMGFRLEEAAE